MFVANPKLASRGGLAVAVPGELKGLEYAWKNVSLSNVINRLNCIIAILFHHYIKII